MHFGVELTNTMYMKYRWVLSGLPRRWRENATPHGLRIAFLIILVFKVTEKDF